MRLLILKSFLTFDKFKFFEIIFKYAINIFAKIRKFKVLSNNDIEKILESAKKGLDFVVIEVKDWKIIPLENIIAKLHKINTKIFAIARNPKEVRKMFSILDVGVDVCDFADLTWMLFVIWVIWG